MGDRLDAIADTWQKTDLVEEKSDVIHAIHERIVIEGRASSACASHRPRTGTTALALPEAVMARPTGVGRAIATYDMRIEGRDAWLAAARRLA